MENHKSQPVSPAQGAENTEFTTERARKLLKSDLLTALAVLHVVVEDKAILAHVNDAIHLKVAKEGSSTITDTQLSDEVRLASALLKMIYQESVLLDDLAANVAEMQRNYSDRKNFGK